MKGLVKAVGESAMIENIGDCRIFSSHRIKAAYTIRTGEPGL